MKLAEFLVYDRIVIQCHDNPDADAIGSGYALYRYFEGQKKKVSFIYSGRNKIQKPNLLMLIESYNIPIEYVEVKSGFSVENGVLITVDCQYGAGNVTRFEAERVAIIDHHQIETEDVELSLIRPELGSCSTLVWSLLEAEGYVIDDKDGVGTGLYYGLFSDTNQLSEVFNPLDRDMIDQIAFDNSKIAVLRNSNISLDELEIAGVAMLRYSYNEDYGFVVVKAAPCDPNILGLINDFLLQVNKVFVSLVFNDTGDGYKLSIRSCVRMTDASELAAFITKNIGSGGGHFEKAGGYVSKRLYYDIYKDQTFEKYVNTKIAEYYNAYEVIEAKDYKADLSSMKSYRKKPVKLGYVKVAELLPIGTPITVRALEGDSNLEVSEDLYIMIGVKGEVYPVYSEKFLRSNRPLEEEYIFEKFVTASDYVPNIINRTDGRKINLSKKANACLSTGEVKIYARKLTRGVKVFTSWDKDRYMRGEIGDYLAVRSDDINDIYVIENSIFDLTYESIDE